jgi:hypothetical protein
LKKASRVKDIIFITPENEKLKTEGLYKRQIQWISNKTSSSNFTAVLKKYVVVLIKTGTIQKYRGVSDISMNRHCPKKYNYPCLVKKEKLEEKEERL